ncbi:MAG: hypothetical protein NT084_14125 [Bacteroidetes bacterium]|jgi:hypothetical protein|nr:hypothetical protein [Bacteroidota bacterium]
MKKFLVILALAGMVGSVSATTISLISKTSIVSVKDDGKKKKGKKECTDTAKSCCKKGEAKDKGKCTEKKSGCCKDKDKSATPATPK